MSSVRKKDTGLCVAVQCQAGEADKRSPLRRGTDLHLYGLTFLPVIQRSVSDNWYRVDDVSHVAALKAFGVVSVNVPV